MLDNDIEGGIYVYNSISAALKAKFPRNAKLLLAPRAIVRLKATGPMMK